MAKVEIKMGEIGGGSGRLEKYSLSDYDSYSCIMNSGAYFIYRTDYSDNTNTKGYVDNGVLTQVATNTGTSVAYDPVSKELTVTKTGTEWLGILELVFAIVD